MIGYACSFFSAFVQDESTDTLVWVWCGAPYLIYGDPYSVWIIKKKKHSVCLTDELLCEPANTHSHWTYYEMRIWKITNRELTQRNQRAILIHHVNKTALRPQITTWPNEETEPMSHWILAQTEVTKCMHLNRKSRRKTLDFGSQILISNFLALRTSKK